jgi:hypothetical protein
LLKIPAVARKVTKESSSHDFGLIVIENRCSRSTDSKALIEEFGPRNVRSALLFKKRGSWNACLSKLEAVERAFGLF